MSAPVVAPERRPGRPRSTRADEAILQAAIDDFVEHGWDGLTIEGVAARAAVSKTTIYRRYPCRIDLLLAAARRLAAERAPVPDTGALRSDLVAMVDAWLHMVATTRTGQAIPMMVAATAKHPELAAPFREFLAGRRAAWRIVVDRGIARGELAAAVDPELVIDLVVGPLFYRAFVSHEPFDADAVTRLVDSVLHTVA